VLALGEDVKRTLGEAAKSYPVVVSFAGLKAYAAKQDRGRAQQPYGFTGTIMCAYGVLGYISRVEEGRGDA
jgi:hypothetical protein